jgi:hypothetical protein
MYQYAFDVDIAEMQPQGTASRTLIKTGIDSVDAEAIMMHSCLGRLDVAMSVTAERRKPATRLLTHHGRSVDISDRTHMGFTDAEDIDARELATLRSDALVAQCSLQRILRLVASTGETNLSLMQRVAEQEKRINELQLQEKLLQDTVAQQANQLAKLEDSGNCFELYRSSWRRDHDVKQESLDADIDARRTATADLSDAFRGANVQRRIVAARHSAFERTSRHLFRGGDDDDKLFAEIERKFQPMPLTISRGGPSQHALDAAPNFDLRGVAKDDAVSPMGSDSDDNEIAVDAESMSADSEPIEDVLDDLEELLAAATPLRKTEKEEDDGREVRTDELIITRVLNGHGVERSVARVDPASTYIGVLINVLRYAPSKYTVLILDLDGVLGRQQQLARQAALVGVGELWDEVMSLANPVVFVAQCDAPQQADHESAFVPEGHCVDDDDAGRVDKFLAFKRLRVADAVDGATPTPKLTSTRMQHSAAPATVATRQQGGILAVLSRGRGGSVVNVISQGLVRCYSSSTLHSCHMDALITPFHDQHSPFYMTDDAHGQYVQVSFNRIAVAPTAYSFAACHPTIGGYYPRHWRLEGSLDGMQWTLLRRHVNDDTLTKHRSVAVWDIERKSSSTYYSHFRVVHEGVNALGTRHLSASAFEFYGRTMYARERVREPANLLPSVGPRVPKFSPFEELPPMLVEKKKKAPPKKK